MIDFTSGNPMKQIFNFALPMLVGNLLQQLYSMADTIVVGRFVSGTALAAVGSSSSIIQFLVSVLIGLTTGASVVISQFYGAKKEAELKRTVSTSIIFMAVFSIIITIGGVAGAGPLLRFLGVDESIYEGAKLYLTIIMAGVTFPVYFNMYMAYMRALGDSKSPLYILLFSTTLNIVLDVLFVAGLGWGIAGAAIATIIAQTLAMVFCIWVAVRKIHLLRINKLEFDKNIFKLILTYGVPSSIQLSITSLASMTIMRLVNSFGAITVAGFTAGVRVENFALMPLSNVFTAISTFVGQNMGANQEDRAKEGLMAGLKLMVVISIITSVLIIVFSRFLMAQFVGAGDINAAAIISEGTIYLSIISLFYILFAVFFAFNGFFRGVGDAIIVMILTITSLTIRTVSAHFLAANFGMGIASVAWSIPIGWGLCGAFGIFYYKMGWWRGKVATDKV